MNSLLTATDLWALFGHFLLLSLLSVGGAMAAAPDMHRYIVEQQHWLTDGQFSASVAIAQAAPGPNVLFVAAIGWNVAGPLGALATLAGILLPSTVLSLWVTRWGMQRRETRAVRAFTTGLAPLTIGLLLATGWILAEPFVRDPQHRLGAGALIAITVAAIARTRISPMRLIALGAVVGAVGWA